MDNIDLQNKIQSYLRGLGTSTIPGSRKLAELFKVTPERIRKVLKNLEALGYLHIQSRSKTKLLIQKRKYKSSMLLNAPQKLRVLLIKKMQEAYYEEGKALPKIITIMQEYGVSDHTVRRTLQLLIDENYLIRIKRQFIVSSKFNLHLQKPSSPLTICIFIRNHRYWEFFQGSERTGKYCRAFLKEVEDHSVYLHFITYNISQQDIADFDIVISNHFNLAQMSIIGSLILGIEDEKFPVFEMITKLLPLEKPVVWMDPGVKSPPLWLNSLKTQRHLSYCHFDERHGMHAALRFVSEHGHQKIGYLIPESHEWIKSRGRLLEEFAHDYFPKLKLQSFEFLQDVYNNPAHFEMASRLSLLLEKGPPQVRFAIEFLGTESKNLLEKYGPPVHDETGNVVWHLIRTHSDWSRRFQQPTEAPVLDSIRIVKAWLALYPLWSTGVTCILSPSDLMTKNYILSWILEAQLNIPLDVSLLSFDCRNIPMGIPVSSVDFGFGYLGEKSFEILFQAKKKMRTRSKDVPAYCRVVDRGTIAWKA